MKILKDHGVKAKWYVLGEGELRDRLQIKINHLGLKDDFILLGAAEIVSRSLMAWTEKCAS